MSEEQHIPVPGATAGLRLAIPVFRFGRRDAPRSAYIQAGLHADEAPGLLVAQHLKKRLTDLEAADCINGQITLVTASNPIGLSQFVLGGQEGRFNLADGVNFNRDFPLLTDAAIARLEGKLSTDARENGIALVSALRESAAAAPATTPAQHLKRLLLTLAIGADTVLDLHCDGEAVMHLYTLASQARDFAPLARLVGARAHLIAEVSGGSPFDEAVSRPPSEIARHFSGYPFPPGPIATTLELRGQTDVDSAQAAADAEAIISFLINRGQVRGAMPELPPAACEPTLLDASEAIQAPHAGILVYTAALGAQISEGELIAEIVDPANGTATPVHARTAGVLFARASRRMIMAGARIGKIAGRRTIRSGDLLSP